MSREPWWVPVVLGFLLAALGTTAILAGRRLQEALRRDPFHREGDALAAYLPGCGALLLGLGVLGLVLGLWQGWPGRPGP